MTITAQFHPLHLLRLGGGEFFRFLLQQRAHGNQLVQLMGCAAAFQPMGRAGTVLGAAQHGQGQNSPALVLAQRPAAVGDAAQHGDLPPGAAAGQGDGVQTDPAGLDGPLHRQCPGVGALYLMEDPLADDAGKGDLPRPGLEAAAHAVSFLAAVGAVSAARPVVEQHRQSFIFRSGDGFCFLIDHENAVGICLIVPQKEGFYKLPEGLIQFFGFMADILRG